VLAPDIPVGQFHLARPCPAGQQFQARGQARIKGVKRSRVGGQGHGQLSVTLQHGLCPGEELHVPSQSRYGCQISRAGDPAAALTHWQGGLHPRRIGRGRAYHRHPLSVYFLSAPQGFLK